ncbi:hypothetical protein D3C71_1516190 [compost metagenome]
MAEHLLVGFDNLGRRLFRVDILRFKVNQLFLTFSRQQLHRPVTAGELFIFVAIEDQIR